MDMFSKELREMDRNTVKYMIDELNEELTNIKKKNQTQESEIRKQKKLLRQKDTALAEKEAALVHRSIINRTF